MSELSKIVSDFASDVSKAWGDAAPAALAEITKSLARNFQGLSKDAQKFWNEQIVFLNNMSREIADARSKGTITQENFAKAMSANVKAGRKVLETIPVYARNAILENSLNFGMDILNIGLGLLGKMFKL